jgi:hypothetical protein
MLPDLTLRDQATLVGMHEFDRVFDRDDVVAAIPVDEVDQAAEGRGLAAPGGTSDQDETLGEIAEALDLRRDPHFLGRDHAR